MKRAIAVILVFGVAAYAQTLGELLEKAKNNPALQAQMLQEQKSESQKGAAMRAYSPTIEAIGAYSKKANTVVFEPKAVKTGEIRASMTLFDGLRRESTLGAAAKNRDAQKQTTEFTRQNIYLDITKEYYAYFDALYSLEAVDFKLRELEQNIKKFGVLVTNGLATKDSLEAMVASKKEAEYERENISLAMQSAQLNMELYTSEKISDLHPVKLAEYNAQETQRADIKADKLLLESLGYREGQYTYLPTFVVQDSFKKSSYSTYDDMGGLQKLPENNNELLVQLSFTLFDFGRISKEKEAAKLETMAAAKNLAYKQNALGVEISLRRIALEAAKKKLEAAKAGLEATSTAYEYTKKRFDENLISYTDYLSELTKKQDAITRAKTAENAVELKKAELAFASGIDINSLIKGN